MALPRSFGVSARITPTRQQPAGVAIPEGAVFTSGAHNTGGTANEIDMIDGTTENYATIFVHGSLNSQTFIVYDLGTWYRIKSLFGSLFKTAAADGCQIFLSVSEDGRVFTAAHDFLATDGGYTTFNDNNAGAGWDNVRFIKFLANNNDAGFTSFTVSGALFFASAV